MAGPGGAAEGDRGAARRADGGEAGADLDRRAYWVWAFAWPLILLLLFSVSVGVDLVADFDEGIRGTHVVVEAITLLLALSGVGAAAWQLRAAVRNTWALQRDLVQTRADLERWRAESQSLMRDLGSALELQFVRWGLTVAECEIALLILKGFSYKEVAHARGTTERTVRHQALAIYRKAGFAGRAELAAFFLNDLLLPAQMQPAGEAARYVERAASRARA